MSSIVTSELVQDSNIEPTRTSTGPAGEVGHDASAVGPSLVRSKTLLAGIGFHWRGLVAAVIVTMCGASALVTPPWTAVGSWASCGFLATGWMLLVAGTAWRFWATLYIGGRKLGGRKNFGVVTEGPYSVCRNPLYFGTACILLSGMCFLQSTLFAVGLAGIGLFYILATIPAEESFLREHLGVTYLDYCRRVPRYLPRFSLYESPKMVEVNVRHVWNEAQRAARWLLLPIAVEVIGRLRIH
jgi:protein-S-isoprenylcysteine O-methyltransferase Ste14